MQIRNHIMLIGNVGQQPEVVNTKNDTPMLRFSLATNDYWKDKSGNRQTKTEWHNIVVFGAKAESLKNLIKKGSLLAISGQLRYNKYVDKNDQQRSVPQIHVNDVQILTPKTETSSEPAFA